MFTETEKMQLCFAGGCRFVNSLADCAGLEHEYYNPLPRKTPGISPLFRYAQRRWVLFVVPILLALRLSLVSLCLFIGSFFFAETNGKKFKDWWGIATIAQAVILADSVILCIVNIAFGADTAKSGNPDIFVIPSNERPRPIAETYYFDGSKV